MSPLAGNYDYQFDTILHPSGSIELEVRASGFLLARYWDVDARGAYGKFAFFKIYP
jgi:Cu2+-containing amine oxidase